MAREVIEDLIQAGKFAAHVSLEERREGDQAFVARTQSQPDPRRPVRNPPRPPRPVRRRLGRWRRVTHRLAADSTPEEFNSSPLPSQSPILMAYISGEMMPSRSSTPLCTLSSPLHSLSLSSQKGQCEGATNSIFHESPISSGCDRTFCGGNFHAICWCKSTMGHNHGRPCNPRLLLNLSSACRPPSGPALMDRGFA